MSSFDCASKLAITDGETEISLTRVENQSTMSPGFDGFGQTQFMPHGYDRDLTAVADLLFQERYSLNITEADADSIATETRKLWEMLREAWLYNNKPRHITPVYLVARVRGETEYRYAHVWECPMITGSFPVLNQLFEQSVVLDNVGVAISRFIWRDGIIGEKGSAKCLVPTDGEGYSDQEQIDYRNDFRVNLGEQVTGIGPSTQTGGIIGGESKNGFLRAVQVAEAVTNECENPSFEVNVSDFWSALGNHSVQQVSGGVYGVSCARITSQGAGAAAHSFRTDDMNLAASDHTFSFYARSISGSTTLHGEFQGAGGATNFTLTTEWQRFNALGTPAGTPNSFLFLWLAAVGVCEIDAVQVETTDYPTPYCDGFLGWGHTWGGTAHDSTSARTDTTLDYPLDLQDPFAIGFLWKGTTSVGDSVGNPRIVEWRADGDNVLLLFYLTASSVIQANHEVNNVAVTTNSLADIEAEAEYWIVFAWDGSVQYLYINGALQGSDAQVENYSLTTASIYLGHASGGTNDNNGWLDDLFILDEFIDGVQVGEIWKKISAGIPYGADGGISEYAPAPIFYLNFEGEVA